MGDWRDNRLTPWVVVGGIVALMAAVTYGVGQIERGRAMHATSVTNQGDGTLVAVWIDKEHYDAAVAALRRHDVTTTVASLRPFIACRVESGQMIAPLHAALEGVVAVVVGGDQAGCTGYINQDSLKYPPPGIQ